VDGSERERAETRPTAFVEYSDAGYVAQFLRVLLLLNAVTSLVVAALSMSFLTSVRGLGGLSYGTSSTVRAGRDELSTVALVDLGVRVLCIALFVVWTYRTYRNLRSLGATDLRFRSGWAIGGWFVPIVALWRPKQVVNDVWRASDEELPANFAQTEWRDRVPPLLMTAWWTLWLAAVTAAWLAAGYGLDTLAQATAGLPLQIAASVSYAAAAVLAAQVVVVLTRRQQRRAQRLGELATPAPGLAGVGPERPIPAGASSPLPAA
jgi:hypothetical protein